MNFYMPTKVLTGDGCVRKKAAFLTVFSVFGERCLIVTGKRGAKVSGALEDVTAVLDAAGVGWTVWDGVAPNPSVASCVEGGRIARENGAAFVIGVGGGSPLDAAKAVSVFAANADLDEAGFYAKTWPNAPLPFLLVGTTAGTGSEVTAVTVLTDGRGRKHSLKDERLRAAVAFGDPNYTMSLPRGVTLSTGADALAHCMESYFSKKADEVSRAFALRGAALLLQALDEAERAAGELPYELRERLYDASLLGGLAINSTGTTFPHNMSYFLTERYHVPHGIACAAWLPELLTHVEKCAPSIASAFYAGTGADRAAYLELLRRAAPPPAVKLTAAEIAELLPRWENNASVFATLGTVTMEQIREMLTRNFGA